MTRHEAPNAGKRVTPKRPETSLPPSPQVRSSRVRYARTARSTRAAQVRAREAIYATQPTRARRPRAMPARRPRVVSRTVRACRCRATVHRVNHERDYRQCRAQNRSAAGGHCSARRTYCRCVGEKPVPHMQRQDMAAGGMVGTRKRR